ncbi:glycosyltransferase [Spiribacter vilamensis]|uniref:UDP-N-acetylglucosamine transferase subunit ALG13 n=1 Tax=Spiribacter vilamensis TaxID=531306 RepID=A0A4Q8CZA9_9GAMM|nr:glycosyltransferase [Spiribacter vilamensis]RZU98361.1 UDP-N-acetylglucosamine transferase subunit ALG13 [Spiribacter vilamensis]TVO60756.1 glycosyl transferase family 28 [Spiribacter vilamensis]
MILVSVGSELPFDRLVRGVDIWRASHPTVAVFAQIADPGGQGYYPQNIEWARFLTRDEYDRRFAEADLVVAHAGMGSIISALVTPKPIVIMPRRMALGEVRNDHQLATVEKFRNHRNVHAAANEDELPAAINAALEPGATDQSDVAQFADASLINAVRMAILGQTGD